MSQLDKYCPTIILRKRPRPYDQTAQQRAFAEAAEHCGIRKGMSREELVDKMKNCLPEYWRQKRGEVAESGLRRLS